MKSDNIQRNAGHAADISLGRVGTVSAVAEMPIPVELYNPAVNGALVAGDVVVVNSAGQIATTTTAQDPRPTGVVVDDIDADDYGLVAFWGPTDIVNLVSSGVAGQYVETSTTAKKGLASAAGSNGFAYLTSSGVSPSAFIFGGRAGGIGSGGGSALTVKDEGSNLDTAVTSIDFVGGGVTATNVSHAVTVTIPTASAGSSSSADSSGDVTVTGSLQDVTGCSVSLVAGTWIVTGVYDVLVNSASDRLFEGHLDSGGSDQTLVALLDDPALTNARQTVVQHWRLTLGSTTTVKLRCKYSGGTTGDFTVKANSRIAAWQAGSTFDPDSHLPWHVNFTPMIAKPDAMTGTWALVQFNDASNTFFVQATASVGAIGFYNSTSAQNDAFSYNVILAAGTWDCNMWVRKSTNTAIITLNMDGVSQGTVDTYAASVAYAQVAITGFTVSATGKKVMQFKAATKNASSSNYLIELFGIEFQRTA